MRHLYLKITALNGLLAVGLGALGAHALHERLLAREMLNAWQTASTFQLIHAVAALGVFAWARAEPGRNQSLHRVGWFWLVGGLVFAGSIYCLALGGPKVLGPVTPLGGLSFMCGWIFLSIEAFRKPSPGASSAA